MVRQSVCLGYRGILRLAQTCPPGHVPVPHSLCERPAVSGAPEGWAQLQHSPGACGLSEHLEQKSCSRDGLRTSHAGEHPRRPSTQPALPCGPWKHGRRCADICMSRSRGASALSLVRSRVIKAHLARSGAASTFSSCFWTSQTFGVCCVNVTSGRSVCRGGAVPQGGGRLATGNTRLHRVASAPGGLVPL